MIVNDREENAGTSTAIVSPGIGVSNSSGSTSPMWPSKGYAYYQGGHTTEIAPGTKQIITLTRLDVVNPYDTTGGRPPNPGPWHQMLPAAETDATTQGRAAIHNCSAPLAPPQVLGL